MTNDMYMNYIDWLKHKLHWIYGHRTIVLCIIVIIYIIKNMFIYLIFTFFSSIDCKTSCPMTAVCSNPKLVGEYRRAGLQCFNLERWLACRGFVFVFWWRHWLWRHPAVYFIRWFLGMIVPVQLLDQFLDQSDFGTWIDRIDQIDRSSYFFLLYHFESRRKAPREEKV